MINRRKIVVGLVLTLATLTACGDDDDGGTDSGVSPNSLSESIEFYEVVHDQSGTRYRCLYIYKTGYQEGGPAMWCENLTKGET